MQISESSISGLKRELKVVIGQGELGERFASRLDAFKDQVVDIALPLGQN